MQNGLVRSDRCETKFRIFIDALCLDFDNATQRERVQKLLREHVKLKLADLYIVARLWWKEDLLCSPVRTSYKCMTEQAVWNEWIQFQIPYCEIPKDAILTFDLYNPCLCEHLNRSALNMKESLVSYTVDNDIKFEMDSGHVAGTTVKLWGPDDILPFGFQHLKMWIGKESDSAIESTTNGQLIPLKLSKPSSHSQIAITEKSLMANANDISEILSLQAEHSDQSRLSSDVHRWVNASASRKFAELATTYRNNSNSLYLKIKFEQFKLINTEIPVFIEYSERENGITHMQIPCSSTDFCPCPDGELTKPSLYTNMYRLLARTRRMHDQSSKDARPSSEERHLLMQILSYPPDTSISSDEMNLIWNYRYFLSLHPRALPKFLLTVNWKSDKEVTEAQRLIRSWSVISIIDALLLLGPELKYHRACVQSYALDCIRSVNDADLCFYMPQLVQTLKYFGVASSIKQPSATSDHHSKTNKRSSSDKLKSGGECGVSEMAGFLIDRCCQCLNIATAFYWNCKVEFEALCAQNRTSKNVFTFRQVFTELFSRLRIYNDKSRKIYRQLASQRRLIEKLTELTSLLKRQHGSINRQEKLQSILKNEDNVLCYNFRNFSTPFSSPLDPNIVITGVLADQCRVYQSAQCPCKIVFKTLIDDWHHSLIFKSGDDLRQDQLVMQLVQLLDRTMKTDNLDLHITSYKVLATGHSVGLVEYIESMTLRTVKSTYQTIRNYFILMSRQTAGAAEQQRIDTDILDAYVKSCAGYCVITYLLGVGDRHLDNLLLRPSGQLFHIDFSFIFGRDPKPLPPAVKVNKDMIVAMEERVTDFRRHCFTAFLHLRRHAGPIFVLLSVMLDSSIPDIALEPQRVIRKVYEKFHFELDDESAVSYLQRTIDQSISSLVPQLMDILHGIATAVR